MPSTDRIRPARRRLAHRPRLDALEGRQLLAAGALDTAAFNPPNGYVLTGFSKGGPENATADSIAIQTDEKIVAAGRAADHFALARYNTDGTLDASFGSGGEVQTSFSTKWNQINAIAIQPSDGKIVVAGYSNQGTKSTNYDFAIARYNPNGTLDTTFGPGKNGKVSVNINNNTDDEAWTLVLQPDGKIVVGGYTGSNYMTSTRFALVRLTASGNLDATFGANGIVTTDVSPGNSSQITGLGLVTVTVNGAPTTEIVASGTTPGASAVARYNLDGSLDATFGSGGVVSVITGLNFNASGRLAVQPDGKIVITGRAHPNLTSSELDFAAVRLNPDGTLDATFNPSGPKPGLATVNGCAGAVADVAVQPADGKLVLVGADSGVSPQSTAVARLNADGSIDASFGSGGVSIHYLGDGSSSSGDYGYGVALQADGKIVTVGAAILKGYAAFAVARFLNQAPTTTALASSADPSASGQTVTFTATVGTAGVSAPTGTVSFYDGSALLGTGTLNTANGVTTATLATAGLAVGTHSITAIYGGDGNDQGSTSAVLSEVVNASASPDLVLAAAWPALPMASGAPSSPTPIMVPLALRPVPGYTPQLSSTGLTAGTSNPISVTQNGGPRQDARPGRGPLAGSRAGAAGARQPGSVAGRAAQ